MRSSVLASALDPGPAGMAVLAVAATAMTVATVELARSGQPA
ncbi:MAG TPA: hypothetical protein VF299_07725 [Mycobacterium sp.]